jgi:hypothetical protein
VKLLSAVLPGEFDTPPSWKATVKEKVPAVLGVPLTRPSAKRLTPGGMVPEASAQTPFPHAELSSSLARYGMFTPPSGRRTVSISHVQPETPARHRSRSAVRAADMRSFYAASGPGVKVETGLVGRAAVRCNIPALPEDIMAETRIAREDLDPVLRAHRGNQDLERAFAEARDPRQLLSVLGRYIQFNSAFGAGLANLAGEIAARQGLFRDRDEPLRIVADRAAEVASDFFFAAIDEFDDRATPWRDTHRTLGQATLKGFGAFFGYTPEQLNDIVRINAVTEAALSRVWEGYGVGTRLDDARLFGGMGFHTGSEILADQEFVIIDRTLRRDRADLVRALEGMKVEALGQKHNAYYWIRIHTGVEAEHFDAALKGVNNALRYYAGDADPATVKGWILDGFTRFAGVQGEFMAGLGEA